MVLFTIGEILDIVIMTLFLGFFFKDAFMPPRRHDEDPVKAFLQKKPRHDAFWFAAAVTAPAIILHEFGHKFVAMALHMQATFVGACTVQGNILDNIGSFSCTLMIIGVILKLMNFGFIFFIPAYTSILGGATALQHAFIAFAGPLVNLILWLGLWAARKMKLVKPKYVIYAMLTERINMLLFIFNMLPIPMFDGWTVYSNLWHAIF